MRRTTISTLVGTSMATHQRSGPSSCDKSVAAAHTHTSNFSKSHTESCRDLGKYGKHARMSCRVVLFEEAKSGEEAHARTKGLGMIQVYMDMLPCISADSSL